jgi:hypothetical protein
MKTSHFPTEIIGTRSAITSTSHVVSLHYCNAIRSFQDNSIVVTKKLEQASFKKFIQLKDQWLDETKYISNPQKIYSNGAYLEIICMGGRVTPWIIRELKKDPNHWFHALTQITKHNPKHNPIKDDHAGNLELMRNDWLFWAKNNNIDE